MNAWLYSPEVGILVFLIFLLFIGILNLFSMPRLEQFCARPASLHVAVLVPARNERDNIRACVESFLAQDYPNFQILVLDDHSTDETAAILKELASANPHLRVLQGNPLPAGWLGKHWACHQLASATQAELILFTDADTRHHPHALSNAVAAMHAQAADLLTVLPHERVETWGEKLIVPLLLWSIFYFLPLPLAQRLQSPALSATIGQFMLFRRAAYTAIGGHAAVRQHIADDLALGRRIIAGGLCWRLVDGSSRVECRMYRTGREAFDGFSKNLFAAFDYRALLFIPIWTWLGIVFLAPLPLAFAGSPPAQAAIALALVLWAVFYRRFHFPLYLTLFYPMTIALALLLAFRSLVWTRTGRAMWKGRMLSPRANGQPEL